MPNKCPHCKLLVEPGTHRAMYQGNWWHIACAKLKLPWVVFDSGMTETGRITSDRPSMSDIERSVDRCVSESVEVLVSRDSEDDNVLPDWHRRTVPETPDIWFDWVQGRRLSAEHWSFEECLKHARCSELDTSLPVTIREHRVDEIFETVEFTWDKWNRLTLDAKNETPDRRCYGAGREN